MRILGIDPGYAIVGYGVVDYASSRFSLREYGAVTTKAGEDMFRRLENIYDGMTEIIRRENPDAVAIEQLFFTTNQKTAIAVAQARGVLVLCAQKHGIPIFEYTPLQVKLAVVGYGKAEKIQVMDMTKRILKLKETPKPDDAADALAIAICHGHTNGSNIKQSLIEKALLSGR